MGLIVTYGVFIYEPNIASYVVCATQDRGRPVTCFFITACLLYGCDKLVQLPANENTHLFRIFSAERSSTLAVTDVTVTCVKLFPDGLSPQA